MFACRCAGASGGGRVLFPPKTPPPASQSGLTRTEWRFKRPMVIRPWAILYGGPTKTILARAYPTVPTPYSFKNPPTRTETALGRRR